jgi:hypothetical protein
MERWNPCSFLTGVAVALAFSAPTWANDEGTPPSLAKLKLRPAANVTSGNLKVLNDEGLPPQRLSAAISAGAATIIQAQSKHQDEGLPPGQYGPS